MKPMTRESAPERKGIWAPESNCLAPIRTGKESIKEEKASKRAGLGPLEANMDKDSK